jgi:hypothetical protein
LHKADCVSTGFFLLQLQIALILLFFMIGITVPQTSFFKRWHLQAEIGKMYTLFHYAHQKARTLHTDVTILYNEQEGTYQCDTITEQLPSFIIFGASQGIKGPPASPKDSVTQAITFPGKKVICYADGTISSGSIYITDQDRMYTYAITVGVSQVSFIRMYRFDTTWVPLV